MNFFLKIGRKIRLEIRQRYYKFKMRNTVECKRKVTITDDCLFEGNNKLGKYVIFEHSSLGKASYISNNSYFIDTSIGKFCSIGPFTRVVVGEHPSDTFVSTHPSFYSNENIYGMRYVKKNKYDEIKYVDGTDKVLVIGNDVWIGSNVTILSGLKIGDGAIIAAGTVVTKDVAPYSIVGGVPAKIIRMRFSEEQIKNLLRIEWWNKEEDWIKEHAESFENIDTFFSDIDI